MGRIGSGLTLRLLCSPPSGDRANNKVDAEMCVTAVGRPRSLLPARCRPFRFAAFGGGQRFYAYTHAQRHALTPPPTPHFHESANTNTCNGYCCVCTIRQRDVVFGKARELFQLHLEYKDSGIYSGRAVKNLRNFDSR